GGPEAVTAFARSIDDRIFRLERWEPELNSAVPGDPRDTSTPAAMERNLHRLALGNILAPHQRKQFVAWLKGNKTGDARIRAGVPKNWIVGDKTGTGSYGTTNDVGILWPASGAPIIAAIYFTQPDNPEAPPRDDVIASVTRILVGALR
ncbi:MAG TPA: serine hydrolase, partial [Herminiimonas sp.]|nr:serine hydrolase [Herminiimonas sp.]